MKQINGIIMQYFEWYMNCNQNLWNEISQKAEKLADMGITALWLPPAFKGVGGKDEVGYGVYDVYDLGEFEQKGTIKTKYGSKEEYLNCIQVLNQNGIEAYADIVLNHKMGADMLQTIPATKVDWGNHNILTSGQETVRVATKFTFPGRKHKYSDFEWNWTHFDGIDYDEKSKEHAIFKFQNKEWNAAVDEEYGNYDYLMGADIDFSNPEVVEECNKWGKWYVETTNIDGLRLDAVKHIKSGFMAEFIHEMRKIKKLDCVGEYWNRNLQSLENYITKTNSSIPLFDVPLHYNLFEASNSNGNYDMARIFDNTLVKEMPQLAVTFVDNHDTEPGQALFSWIQEWFKPLAYSLILLRKDGLPCVFYGDFYGIPSQNIKPMGEKLEKIIKARKYFAYGEQIDYFDHHDIIAWVRTGDDEHTDSGMVTILSDGPGGSKMINVGKKLAHTVFYDWLGNVQETVYVDQDGNGIFYCNGGSVSIWVKKENIYN